MITSAEANWEIAGCSFNAPAAPKPTLHRGPYPETPAELIARAKFRDRIGDEAFDARDHGEAERHWQIAEGYRRKADAMGEFSQEKAA